MSGTRDAATGESSSPGATVASWDPISQRRCFAELPEVLTCGPRSRLRLASCLAVEVKPRRPRGPRCRQARHGADNRDLPAVTPGAGTSLVGRFALQPASSRPATASGFARSRQTSVVDRTLSLSGPMLTTVQDPVVGDIKPTVFPADDATHRLANRLVDLLINGRSWSP